MGLGFLAQIIGTPPSDPLQKGVVFGEQLQKLRNQKLANQISQAKLPFAGPQAQATLGLTQAQTQLALAKTKDPFHGQIFPGPAGRTQGLEFIRHKFGDASPQYAETLKDYHSTIEAQQARSNYYNANYWLKNIPTTRKNQIMTNYETANANRVKAGGDPMTFPEFAQATGLATGNAVHEMNTATNLATQERQQNPNLSNSDFQTNVAPKIQSQQIPDVDPATEQHLKTVDPNYQSQEDFQNEANQTELKILKDTTDPNTRKRVLYSTNVDKTIHRVNAFAPDALSFSSPVGKFEKSGDATLAFFGHTTPSYQNLINFNKSLDLMKEQIVQFYDLSKEPQKGEEARKLFATMNFKANPQQALDTLRNVEQTYNVERNTFIRAETDPTIFTEKRPSVDANLPRVISKSQPGAGTTNASTPALTSGLIKGSDGKLYTRAQLEKIRDAG